MADISFDTRSFERGLDKMARSLSEVGSRHIARDVGRGIVEAAKEKVPRKTGALADSAFVRDGAAEGQVVIGFSAKYAAVQDLGRMQGGSTPGKTPMQPKPYGSDRGPNYYFSQTFKLSRTAAMEQLAAKVAEALASAGGGG